MNNYSIDYTDINIYMNDQMRIPAPGVEGMTEAGTTLSEEGVVAAVKARATHAAGTGRETLFQDMPMSPKKT